MTYYLNYRIRNDEPFRIADDSIAQKGQRSTLHFIPGSAVRGYVITALSKQGFGDTKEELFTKVRFLNAYPTDGNTNLFPSPKGFYEDKSETDGKKHIENVVVDGKDIEGLKRARLGEFCKLSDRTLGYYSIKSKGELKKKMYGNEMYRIEYIDRGIVFAGAIASENRQLLEEIRKCFEDGIMIGNGRSAGLGHCKTEETVISEETPYKELAVTENISNECYMMLLSPMSMRDKSGEPVGLDLETLQEKLGVSNLRVRFCSTSVRNVHGYNRTWHLSVPSVAMYDKGSVFHFFFDGEIKADTIRRIMDEGLGERLYDGYGRVIFLKGYEQICEKERCFFKDQKCKAQSEPEDSEVLKQIASKYYRSQIEDAMNRYIVFNPLKKGMLGSSKTRGIEPILVMNRFNYEGAVDLLNRYFEHEGEKEKAQKIHKELKSTGTIKDHVFTVLNGDIEELLNVKTKGQSEIMSIPKKQLLTEEEIGELKLRFILKELRFDSRKEEKG